MSIKLLKRMRHWFTPHVSNNFRAKILHSSGLLSLIGVVLTFQLLIRLIDATPYHILGFTSTITIEDVVRLTNEKRVSVGLPPLTYSETLADAARRKANNMFEENYWAHNSNSGKSPWYWFDQVGYKYIHAGENLAKDFGNADRLITAWMNSPTHRDNIVSSKYKEIGVAVVPGTLQGQDTVLVVQLFGSTVEGSIPAVSGVKANRPVVTTPKPSAVVAPTPLPAPIQVAEVKEASEVKPPLAKYNEFNVKKTAAIATTALLMLALILDLIIAENSYLARRVGKNWAHLVFINIILLLVTFVQAGSII